MQPICSHLKQGLALLSKEAGEMLAGWEPRLFSVRPCSIPVHQAVPLEEAGPPKFRISTLTRTHHKMAACCPLPSTQEPGQVLPVRQSVRPTHQTCETGHSNRQAPNSNAAVTNPSAYTLLQPHICPLPIYMCPIPRMACIHTLACLHRGSPIHQGMLLI